MAFKSKFTGAKIDELLTIVQTQQDDPSSILNELTEEDILNKLTAKGLIDKINTAETNIVFTKFVDCQAEAGKTV